MAYESKIVVRLDEKTKKDLAKIVRLMDLTSRFRVTHTMSDAVRYSVALAVSLLANGSSSLGANTTPPSTARDTASDAPQSLSTKGQEK